MVSPSGADERTVAAERERDAQLVLPAPASPHRRGWLMRRLLLIADVVGLLSAFLLALALFSAGPPVDVVEESWEIVFFVASLPLWVLLARVHGLYDRDEERTDHSTVDDIFGVFQVVSVGTWGFLAATEISRPPAPAPESPRRLLGARHHPRAFLAGNSAVLGRRNIAYIQNVIVVGWERWRSCSRARSRTAPSTGSGSSVSSIATAAR